LRSGHQSESWTLLTLHQTPQVGRFAGTFDDYRWEVQQLSDLGSGAVLAVLNGERARQAQWPFCRSPAGPPLPGDRRKDPANHDLPQRAGSPRSRGAIGGRNAGGECAFGFREVDVDIGAGRARFRGGGRPTAVAHAALNIIQRQLGHANLGTTSIYLQASTPRKSSSDCVVEFLNDGGKDLNARSGSRFKGIAWVDPLDIGVQQVQLRWGASGRPTRVDAAHDLHVLLRNIGLQVARCLPCLRPARTSPSPRLVVGRKGMVAPAFHPSWVTIERSS
jgi:hypothetical protein